MIISSIIILVTFSPIFTKLCPLLTELNLGHLFVCAVSNCSKSKVPHAHSGLIYCWGGLVYSGLMSLLLLLSRQLLCPINPRGWHTSTVGGMTLTGGVASIVMEPQILVNLSTLNLLLHIQITFSCLHMSFIELYDLPIQGQIKTDSVICLSWHWPMWRCNQPGQPHASWDKRA